MPESVVLITGASAGIGAELARVFAARGHRVVLIARRAGRLHELAAEIVAGGAPQPLVIECDLADPHSGDTIAAALQASNVEPAYVVNNAGFGLVGEAMVSDRATQLAMIDVNVRALTDLSLRFAHSLVRHRGGILNVASLAGFLPGPRMAVYYASKAFVVSLSDALHHELAPHRVRVTALCPGPVPTEFQARAGFAPGRRSLLPAPTARQVAELGYRALMAGRRRVVPGRMLSLIPVLAGLTPTALLLALIGRVQRGRSAQ